MGNQTDNKGTRVSLKKQLTNKGVDLTFGERVKLLREHYGISKTELSKATGISMRFLTQLELGERVEPTFSKGLAIAKVLRVPPRALANTISASMPDLKIVSPHGWMRAVYAPIRYPKLAKDLKNSKSPKVQKHPKNDGAEKKNPKKT